VTQQTKNTPRSAQTNKRHYLFQTSASSEAELSSVIYVFIDHTEFVNVNILTSSS